MNIFEIDDLLKKLPQANFKDLLRMDIRLRLMKQREEFQRELEAEGEAARLDEPEIVATETLPYIAPIGPASLMRASGQKAEHGVITHVIVSRAVRMDFIADDTNLFQRVQRLPDDSKVIGFLDTIPVIFDRTMRDGALLRFEDNFETHWIEVQALR